jgi:hypothetical protein
MNKHAAKATGLRPDQVRGDDAEYRAAATSLEGALTLFEVEAFWDDEGSTTVIRYVEARDFREALSVVPEEAIIVRVDTLGGLYRTTRTK